MTSMQPTHPTEPSRFAISTATFRAALVAALVWMIPFGNWFSVFLERNATSVRSAGLFVVVVPFLVFDHMHYLLPAGLGLIGFWLGMLDVHSDWNHDIPESSSDPRRDVNSPTTRRNRP
jgi:hypothetical protein